MSTIRNDSIVLLLGNADGAFGPPSTYTVDADPSSLAIGDFNSDGYLDVVVSHSTTTTASLLLGDGNGRFASSTPVPAAGPSEAVRTGDLTGDGVPDIVIANNAGGTVDVLAGQGGRWL